VPIFNLVVRNAAQRLHTQFVLPRSELSNAFVDKRMRITKLCSLFRTIE
jgi:hypothetical protein